MAERVTEGVAMYRVSWLQRREVAHELTGNPVKREVYRSEDFDTEWEALAREADAMTEVGFLKSYVYPVVIFE